MSAKPSEPNTAPLPSLALSFCRAHLLLAPRLNFIDRMCPLLGPSSPQMCPNAVSFLLPHYESLAAVEL
jgi:hypothetical protein